MVRVEAIDGLDGREQRDLPEIVGGHPSVGVAAGDVIGEPDMDLDEFVPDTTLFGLVILVEQRVDRLGRRSLAHPAARRLMMWADGPSNA